MISFAESIQTRRFPGPIQIRNQLHDSGSFVRTGSTGSVLIWESNQQFRVKPLVRIGVWEPLKGYRLTVGRYACQTWLEV